MDNKKVITQKKVVLNVDKSTTAVEAKKATLRVGAVAAGYTTAKLMHKENPLHLLLLRL